MRLQTAEAEPWHFPGRGCQQRKWHFLSPGFLRLLLFFLRAFEGCSNRATSSRAMLIPFLMAPRTVSKGWHFVNPGIINHHQCFYSNSSVSIVSKGFRSCELLYVVVEDGDADIFPGHKIPCSSSSFSEGPNNFVLKSGQKYNSPTGEAQKDVFWILVVPAAESNGKY